jgi:hypothetical protein
VVRIRRAYSHGSRAGRGGGIGVIRGGITITSGGGIKGTSGMAGGTRPSEPMDQADVSPGASVRKCISGSRTASKYSW